MDIENCVKKFDAYFLFLFVSGPPLYNAPLIISEKHSDNTYRPGW